MVMPKKIGKEICPVHRSLGYYRHHNRRKAKSENIRLAEHYTFVHNDRTIKEHYVSKAIRDQKIADEMAQNPFKDWYYDNEALARSLLRIGYKWNKFTNKISKYPLDREEARRLGEAVRPKLEVVKAIDKITSLEEQLVYALTHNLPVPNEVKHGLFTFYEMFKKLKQEIAVLDQRMQNDPVGVIADAIEVSSSDPFNKQVTYLFNKFEQPRRLERNKRRNEKLSRWEGRKTDDYTGIPRDLNP